MANKLTIVAKILAKSEKREFWQIHMNNTHLAQYMKATDGAVEEFTLNEMIVIR
jgi:hypothetical protein